MQAAQELSKWTVAVWGGFYAHGYFNRLQPTPDSLGSPSLRATALVNGRAGYRAEVVMLVHSQTAGGALRDTTREALM
ncbi:hypothetical protein BBta_p0166 (plasmid) [Bradyrhizobium sp. BTAi1]|nr:hypothetical protein BBta_p0166 [Bradyrhizobium sp. BTAi1]